MMNFLWIKKIRCSSRNRIEEMKSQAQNNFRGLKNSGLKLEGDWQFDNIPAKFAKLIEFILKRTADWSFF